MIRWMSVLALSGCCVVNQQGVKSEVIEKHDVDCYFDAPAETSYPPYHLVVFANQSGVWARADSFYNKEYFHGPVSMVGNQDAWTYSTMWEGSAFQIRHVAGPGSGEAQVSFDGENWIECLPEDTE